MICAVLCAGTIAAVVGRAPAQDKAREHSVFYDGRTIELNFVPGKSDFRIGPWNVRTQVVYDRPRDSHPNLYIVAPGTQYALESFEAYAHNEIVSAVPAKSDPVDWDVYFAVVLDPELHEDFKSEQQLIVATQDEFAPAPDMKIEVMPGAALLKDNLHISTLEDLKPYRRPNGDLPKLIIVPAKMSVRASASDPEASTQTSATTRIPLGVHATAVRH